MISTGHEYPEKIFLHYVHMMGFILELKFQIVFSFFLWKFKIIHKKESWKTFFENWP